MKPKAFILASVALFALGVSSATAGLCTTEIENLVKVLAARTRAPVQALEHRVGHSRPHLRQISILRPRR
jgi:hypothetical protein